MMARNRTAIFPESFATLKVADLYRHGVVGPKLDRLRLATAPSGTLIQRMDLGGQIEHLRMMLVAGRLRVTGELLEQDTIISLTTLNCRADGWGHRAAFLCPGCQTPVFHLHAALIERRPDGSALRRELLCRGCHGISRPSWRYAGQQRIERAVLQRISMAEKLGTNPSSRAPGVGGLRYGRWIGRLIRAERQSQAIVSER